MSDLWRVAGPTGPRAILVLLAAAGAPAAQEPQPQLVLKTTTRLVQVSVIATRKGAPAEGLKKEDFALSDNGKPEELRLFSVEGGGGLPSDRKPLPANTFSNRPEHREGTPSSIAIVLLDALNTRFIDRAFARNEIVKYLKSIQPEDHVGLYALGSGISILHDFNSTARELLERLGESRPAGAGRKEPLSLQLDAWLSGRGMPRAQSAFYTEDRVRGTLRALQFIAEHLAGIPGRKSLIWVSAGFPPWLGLTRLGGRKVYFMEDVAQCARALGSANVAIYPVDARGLTAQPEFDASVSGFGKVLNQWYPHLLPTLPRKEDTMRELAERTGGRVYLNTNDLARAIREAVADTRLTYTLGYYPSESQADGTFHSIVVRVSQPGVALRYRKGYFSLPEQGRDEKTRKTELRQVVFSPLEATEIGLRTEFKPVRGRPSQLELLVHIDPRGVSWEPQGDRWVGELDILFIEKDGNGRASNGRDDTLNLRLGPESYRQVTRTGLMYRQSFEPGRSAVEIRVVVRDAASGSVGSVTAPIRRIQGFGR